MGYKAFILFYIVLIETFVELMIKAMDMEILDWTEVTSWKAGKLILMGGILLYHSFYRWIPFVAIRKFKSGNDHIFISPMKASNIPWFFFSNLFHAILLLIFGFVCYKLNYSSWPLYVLLFAGATEILVYLILGISRNLFTIIMGKNNIILSRGYLTLISFNDLKSVERKYQDELYFIMKNGKVETISYKNLDSKNMTEFLIKLKNSCDNHSIYFGNDVMPGE